MSSAARLSCICTAAPEGSEALPRFKVEVPGSKSGETWNPEPGRARGGWDPAYGASGAHRPPSECQQDLRKGLLVALSLSSLGRLKGGCPGWS